MTWNHPTRPHPVSTPASRTRAGTGQPRRWGQRATLLLLTIPVLIPLIGVLLEILTPTPAIWQHLWDTLLLRMVQNTLVLLLGVGCGTFLIGTGLAWLVTAHRFPGCAWFDWLLLLPMAMPGYIMAFVFIATFDFVGPVQSTLRAWFGRDVWFPNIYTGYSAILVMSLVLYPYVYLFARAAFREQSASTFDAARVMGYSRTQTVLQLVLPLARPSLVAGVTLAMMEALTDFATVRFFNYPTLSEGVFRIWERMMNRQAAMELAALLCCFAFAVILLERVLRGHARYYQTGGSSPRLAPVPLRGWRAWGATSACSAVVAVAFVLPVLQLLLWTIEEIGKDQGGTLNVAFRQYVTTTGLLAALAAVVALIWALLLAHTARLGAGRIAALAVRLSTLGYAMPGAVVGVGVLLTLATIDHAINDVVARWRGMSVGLLLTGSIAGLIFAYVVRFIAVAYGSVEASLDKVIPSLTLAARSLGAAPPRVLWRIHLPLVSTGFITGLTLVFVDVMKELPITLLLRPFGMDTLAIWAYLLALEGFWEAAAVPSLTILAVGLIPVALLMRLGDMRPRV